MSKLIPSISGVACLAWVTVWTWWLSNENPSSIPSETGIAISSFVISDGEHSFSTKEIFSFHLSDARPVLPASSLAFLDTVAGYLKSMPEKELTLLGKYLESERNQSPYPNLGLARAHSIKKMLEERGIDKEQILTEAEIIDFHYLVEDRLLGGVDFQFGIKTEDAAIENEESGNEADPASPSILVLDEKGRPETILFNYEKEIFTLARENRSMLDELRRLVRKNPEFRLIISGYSSKEEEKAVDGNLAERRSLAVRRYLVDTGVRRKNIIIASYPGVAKGNDQQRVEISVID